MNWLTKQSTGFLQRTFSVIQSVHCVAFNITLAKSTYCFRVRLFFHVNWFVVQHYCCHFEFVTFCCCPVLSVKVNISDYTDEMTNSMLLN